MKEPEIRININLNLDGRSQSNVEIGTLFNLVQCAKEVVKASTEITQPQPEGPTKPVDESVHLSRHWQAVETNNRISKAVAYIEKIKGGVFDTETAYKDLQNIRRILLNLP